MYNTQTNLANSFQTLMSHVFITYKGCLIEKAGSTYVWGRKCFPNLEAAKAHIDGAVNTIGNSLKVRA